MRAPSLILVSSAALLAGCDPVTSSPPPAAAAVVASITVQPETVTLAVNEWVALKIVVRDSQGTTLPGASVSLVSRDLSVATVNPQLGRIYAGVPGTTVVEVHAGDRVATIPVTVTTAVVRQLSVTPNFFVILPGQQVTLTANPQDFQGAPLSNRPATFSSNSDFVTVTPSGVVTGIAPGSATISVTVEGVSTTVFLIVSPPSVSFEYYKRGGTAAPGTAVLTFAPGDITRGTLAIDGKSLAVRPTTFYANGVVCMVSEVVVDPDAITRCEFDLAPLTSRLCTSVNGASNPGQLQYVLLPANDAGRIPATASEIFSAMQTGTNQQGINVYSDCMDGFVIPGLPTGPPRWVRLAPGPDFYLWPNLTTVYPAASVAAMLDGAVIYSAPGAANDFKKYVAVRVSSTVFEVWH